jgi:cell division septal protein FtsQ
MSAVQSSRMVRRTAQGRKRRHVVASEQVAVWRRIVFWLMTIAYIGGVVFMVGASSYARITTVDVHVEPGIDRTAVRDLVDTYLAEHVFFDTLTRAQYAWIRPDALAQKIYAQSGVIREVSVTKNFPHQIVIDVTAWEHVYLWCFVAHEEQCFVLNDDGTLGMAVVPDAQIVTQNSVTRVEDHTPTTLTTGERPSDVLTPEQIAAFFESMSRAGVTLDTTQITIGHRVAQEVRVTTTEGWDVLISLAHTFDESATMLASVLRYGVTAEERQQLAYIDVRVKDRAFYAKRDEFISAQEQKEEETNDRPDAKSLDDQQETP